MIVAVAQLIGHACKRQCRLAHCHTIGGKVEREKKKRKSSLARNDGKSSGVISLLSSLSFSPSRPPSLSLSLSLSLFLSLSFSLSLSLSLSQPLTYSLAQGAHTETLSSQRSSLRWAHWLCIQLHPSGWVRYVEHSNCRKHALPTRSSKGFPTARKLTTCGVGQRSTSRSLSMTTMTGCKTAPKPEPQATPAIRCRIQEMYCDHSVWREAVGVSLACDKDLESNAERERNRCPARRSRGRDRARGVRQTLHCGPDVRFLPPPPFFYGCCVLYVFNAPLLHEVQWVPCTAFWSMDMTGVYMVYACLFEAVCDVTTVPSHLNAQRQFFFVRNKILFLLS